MTIQPRNRSGIMSQSMGRPQWREPATATVGARRRSRRPTAAFAAVGLALSMLAVLALPGSSEAATSTTTACQQTPRPAVGGTYMLESLNMRGYFLRHRNGQAEISRLKTPLDRMDSTFMVTAGRYLGEGISLRSANYPESFLRHQDLRMRLAWMERDLPYTADATFRAVAGLAGCGSWSFRSRNFCDRFIRHYRGGVFTTSLSHFPGTPARKDASWRMVPVRNPWPSPSLAPATRAGTDRDMDVYPRCDIGGRGCAPVIKRGVQMVTKSIGIKTITYPVATMTHAIWGTGLWLTAQRVDFRGQQCNWRIDLEYYDSKGRPYRYDEGPLHDDDCQATGHRIVQQSNLANDARGAVFRVGYTCAYVVANGQRKMTSCGDLMN